MLYTLFQNIQDISFHLLGPSLAAAKAAVTLLRRVSKGSYIL